MVPLLSHTNVWLPFCCKISCQNIIIVNGIQSIMHQDPASEFSMNDSGATCKGSHSEMRTVIDATLLLRTGPYASCDTHTSKGNDNVTIYCQWVTAAVSANN